MIYGDKTAAEYSEVASRLPAGRAGLKQLIEMGMIETIASPVPSASAGNAAGAAKNEAALVAPQSDVVEMAATHTVDEAALQRLLYPEFVRAVADLGLRAVMLQMKVERAMSARELLALREAVEAAIAKAKGEPARQEFANRINFLLSQ
jgi:hypothetical protein